MDTARAARAWVEGWQRAWPSRDVDGVASLYADGAVFSSNPFRAPESARAYAERAFGEEDLVRAWFGHPVTCGERAAVEYWAVLRSPNGEEITIAGASFLSFAPDGRVIEHRDYWTQTNGSHEPPSGWGA